MGTLYLKTAVKSPPLTVLSETILQVTDHTEEEQEPQSPTQSSSTITQFPFKDLISLLSEKPNTLRANINRCYFPNIDYCRVFIIPTLS